MCLNAVSPHPSSIAGDLNRTCKASSYVESVTVIKRNKIMALLCS